MKLSTLYMLFAVVVFLMLCVFESVWSGVGGLLMFFFGVCFDISVTEKK